LYACDSVRATFVTRNPAAFVLFMRAFFLGLINRFEDGGKTPAAFVLSRRAFFLGLINIFVNGGKT
jgi:hypothetical protein